ncbi:hypothetical protein BASA50_008031 [Batrachochytrium salamandrivorans]|uniref:Uncharacterized protein n=1 Tax=Batrachochytrium salamandrivorans TaxID=1357716 RepID=A0ABQ8F540_9FUNG|nr:hypothetical protein BASA50_008031 [Batrachochytrium salamandrivorans]
MGKAQRKSIHQGFNQKLYRYRRLCQEGQARTQYQQPSRFIHFLEKKAIRPGLEMTELLNTDGFKNNTDETPLFVKIIPATQDSIATKTVYIGETNEDGEFMGEYKRRILRNDHDLMKVIKPEAQGLIHLSSPDDVLLSFDDIKDGEKYQLYKFAQNFQSWQKKRG